MNAFPWMIFGILLAAALLGTAAVLPYSLALNSKMLDKAKEAVNEAGKPAAKVKKMPPKPVLVLIGLAQTLVLMGVAVFVGLLAAQKVGLGTPILQAAVSGQPVSGLILGMLPASILLGLAAGVIMIVIEAAYFVPRIPRQLASADVHTAFWKRVLACFYGGIDEEILMRLFVMSGLVWLLALVWKTPAGAPAVGAFWLANLIAALLFGAGHLPTTAAITRLTPIVVARALLLNGIPGLVCGYLFMQYGLEAAMLSHFSLDILIHLMLPPLMQRRVAALQSEQVSQPA